MSKFTVAICGGGVGGLVLALALQQKSTGDIRVDIYESAKMFTEAGAGVGILKRPWEALKRLGLTDDLSKFTYVPQDEDALRDVMDIRKSDQPVGIPYHETKIPLGMVSFHRADFQRVLASHLDPTITTSHFSKRLSSYTRSAKSADETGSGLIELQFEDGTSANCDVLIGADGIKSVTRRYLLTAAAEEIAQTDPTSAEVLLSKIDPIWSGSIAYRAVVPGENLKRINPGHTALEKSQLYTGKDKHLMVYPISLGSTKLINIVAICSWPEKENTTSTEDMVVRPCDKTEIQDLYNEWEPEVQQLLECLDTATRWPINVVSQLPIAANGCVAIMGDAAHAMTPNQSSGAGQAIEDAYVLAGILAHPKSVRETLPAALKVYEAVRLSKANDVQERSRISGHLLHFEPKQVQAILFKWLAESPEKTRSLRDPGSSDDSNDLDWIGGADNLHLIGEAMVKGWEWSWKTDVDDDMIKAVEILEERLR